MKLVRSANGDDLHHELKRKFAAFYQSSPCNRRRRYPDELQQLVGRAISLGIEKSVLLHLTGLSSAILGRWSAQPTTLPPRRLEVVGSVTKAISAAVLIRLPSGVTIELGDVKALSVELVGALSVTEERHAASC